MQAATTISSPHCPSRPSPTFGHKSGHVEVFDLLPDKNQRITVALILPPPCQGSVLIGNTRFADQCWPGVDHWRRSELSVCTRDPCRRRKNIRLSAATMKEGEGKGTVLSSPLLTATCNQGKGRVLALGSGPPLSCPVHYDLGWTCPAIHPS